VIPVKVQCAHGAEMISRWVSEGREPRLPKLGAKGPQEYALILS
jgi:hypothetical protein